MSNELSGITNKSIRDSIGDRSFNAAGLVVDETNVENPKITSAVEHTVNGVFQTNYAVAAQVDISTLAVISGKDGSELSAAGNASATKAHAALAAGGDTQTLVYVLACKGNVAYVVEPDVPVAASQDDANYDLSCPSGYAPFGLIKIVQSPTAGTGVAAFQFGVDDLTGITNRTSTFFDISVCPPTVADIIEV